MKNSRAKLPIELSGGMLLASVSLSNSYLVTSVSNLGSLLAFLGLKGGTVIPGKSLSKVIGKDTIYRVQAEMEVIERLNTVFRIFAIVEDSIISAQRSTCIGFSLGGG
jgi:hypothetical protein